MGKQARISVRCEQALYDWLAEKAEILPIQPGPGSKENKKLSEYVRLILEAHRAGEKPKIPQADPQVMALGEWLTGLSQLARDFAMVAGETVERLADERRLEEVLSEMSDRMARGKPPRRGRRRKPTGRAS